MQGTNERANDISRESARERDPDICGTGKVAACSSSLVIKLTALLLIDRLACVRVSAIERGAARQCSSKYACVRACHRRVSPPPPPPPPSKRARSIDRSTVARLIAEVPMLLLRSICIARWRPSRTSLQQTRTAPSSPGWRCVCICVVRLAAAVVVRGSREAAAAW